MIEQALAAAVSRRRGAAEIIAGTNAFAFDRKCRANRKLDLLAGSARTPSARCRLATAVEMVERDVLTLGCLDRHRKARCWVPVVAVDKCLFNHAFDLERSARLIERIPQQGPARQDDDERLRCATVVQRENPAITLQRRLHDLGPSGRVADTSIGPDPRNSYESPAEKPRYR